MDKTIYEAMDDSLTTESATNGSAGNPQVGSNVGSDDYATECRSYLSSGDCSGECVGFVKFRLVKHGVISARPLGNGKNVVATLGGLGYTVDRNPAVNSVFSRQSGGGGYGHTGMVSQVNPDGSIVVEEYNQDVSHGYGTRTIPKSEWDTSDYSFAHTEVDYQ